MILILYHIKNEVIREEDDKTLDAVFSVLLLFFYLTDKKIIVYEVDIITPTHIVSNFITKSIMRYINQTVSQKQINYEEEEEEAEVQCLILGNIGRYIQGFQNVA